MSKRRLQPFWCDEAGAVTVDWVLLTASVVFLALIVVSIISPGVNGLGSRIATGLNNVSLGPGSGN